jgi:hypothetical protein
MQLPMVLCHTSTLPSKFQINLICFLPPGKIDCNAHHQNLTPKIETTPFEKSEGYHPL